MTLDPPRSDAWLLAEAQRRNAARGQAGAPALSQLATVATARRDHVAMLLRMGELPTEHDEQAALIEWAEQQSASIPELAKLVAVPNFSGRLGKVPPAAAKIQAAKLNAEGRRKGYPDLLLDVARGGYHGWRGEMKRRKKSTVEPEQGEWHAWLRAQGYFVVLAKGWETMRDTLLAYLALDERDDETSAGSFPAAQRL